MAKIEKWLQYLASLVSRLVLGIIFTESGFGKLTHLDKVIEYFTGLGIPYARLQAPFVSSLELISGVLILFGLLTRLACLPIFGIMTVAILTAKRGDIHELSDFLELSEFLYMVLALWLVAYGAGPFSLDFPFAKVFKKSK